MSWSGEWEDGVSEFLLCFFPNNHLNVMIY